MRPYVDDRVFKSTRSREHRGRSFSGKTNLRRVFKKSERQHGRREAADGLRLLEQEIAEREADERRWAELQEEYEREEREISESLQACGFYDDPWYDDDWEHDRYVERAYDDYEDHHSCRRCEEDDAYDDLARRERYEHRERDLDVYDWDADPDFTEARPSEPRDDRPSMAGASDGYDIRAWRGRKS